MAKTDTELQYGLDDVPPWYTTILLAFQHYLTMFGATIAIPLVVTPLLCLGNDEVARSEIIGTCFFVSGLVTLLQTTLGVRLPIVQGGTFAFVSPIIAIMSMPEWNCDNVLAPGVNSTSGHNNSDEAVPREEWQIRMREVQGAIILAALLQVAVGISGILGPMLRFIGPLTIAPTITLIGLSLFQAAPAFCSKHWGIALFTMFLVILFSQYLRNCDLPCCKFVRGKGCTKRKAPIFKLFPVILAIVLSWFFCWILTIAGALPDDPKAPGYGARTDSKLHVLEEAKWLNIPYPGQWGSPTFSVSSVLGMMAGVLAGMIESIGDYYACARLAGAPPPPTHAINRGVFVEGIGCIIAGSFGTGTGTTSYSENIGAIGITKVGSRRVMQVGGALMMILGILGKFGALFVTIPEPVVGGVFMVMFGMISAVGVSNLQFVDLNSSRNLFIFGFAVFVGLSCPAWLAANPGMIATGSSLADQILTVLATTSMFVGGLIGFVLDNTIPGTIKERGLDTWNEALSQSKSVPEAEKMRVVERDANEDQQCIEFTPNDINRSSGKLANECGPYDLPCGMSLWRKLWCTKFVPICPTFGGCFQCRKDKKSSDEDNPQIEATSAV